MEEDRHSPPLGKAFGVKLRKVRSSVIEKEALERRRSVSPTKPNLTHDSKVEKRRSTPPIRSSTKSSDSRSKVAMRQEAAEQKAIERRKAERKSNSLTNRPVSALTHSHDYKNSRSMDNIKQHLGSKPSPPPKPKHLGHLGIVRPIRMDKRKTDNTNTENSETDAEALIGGSSEIGPADATWAYPLFKQLLDQSSVLAKHVGGAMTKMRRKGEEYWRFYWTSIEEESCPECNDDSCSCSRLRASNHGHRFQTITGLQRPIICDLCAHVLWSRSLPYRICIDCNYTCHEGCEDKVYERCQGADVNLLSKGDQSIDLDVDDTDSGYSGSGRSAGFTLTKEEIISRIKTYNESHGSTTTALTLSSNGSDVFQGTIQVYISLEKPKHTSLETRPTSIFDALDRDKELSPSESPENTMSVCQLPQDAPVSLHISSGNKATEIVSMLLKKFNITDNPKNFALYEQSVEQEQEVKLRKIGDVELPLLNFLRWSTENEECSRRFVLKEHNSAEILWEAFSLPELNNFLRMFDAEEVQGKEAIRANYKLQHTQLLQRLSELDAEKRS